MHDVINAANVGLIDNRRRTIEEEKKKFIIFAAKGSIGIWYNKTPKLIVYKLHT